MVIYWETTGACFKSIKRAMNQTLEHYRQQHNDLITALEKEPAGDNKARLHEVIRKMHDEIIRASNMIDEKRPQREIDRVFERIDKLFNQ